MAREGINVTIWAGSIDAQRCKQPTSSSVIDERGRDIKGEEQMREAVSRWWIATIGTTSVGYKKDQP